MPSTYKRNHPLVISMTHEKNTCLKANMDVITKPSQCSKATIIALGHGLKNSKHLIFTRSLL